MMGLAGILSSDSYLVLAGQNGSSLVWHGFICMLGGLLITVIFALLLRKNWNKTNHTGSSVHSTGDLSADESAWADLLDLKNKAQAVSDTCRDNLDLTAIPTGLTFYTEEKKRLLSYAAGKANAINEEIYARESCTENELKEYRIRVGSLLLLSERAREEIEALAKEGRMQEERADFSSSQDDAFLRLMKCLWMLSYIESAKQCVVDESIFSKYSESELAGSGILLEDLLHETIPFASEVSRVNRAVIQPKTEETESSILSFCSLCFEANRVLKDEIRKLRNRLEIRDDTLDYPSFPESVTTYFLPIRKLYQSQTKVSDVTRVPAKSGIGKDKIILYAACFLSVLLFHFIIWLFVTRPAIRYDLANTYLSEGNYAEARDVFFTLGNYKDAKAQIATCDSVLISESYEHAVNLYMEGAYEEALSAFNEVSDYKDSLLYIEDCNRMITHQSVLPVVSWEFNTDLNEVHGTPTDVSGTTLTGIGGETNVALFSSEGDCVSAEYPSEQTLNFTLNTWIFCDNVYESNQTVCAVGTADARVCVLLIDKGNLICRMYRDPDSYIEMTGRTKLVSNKWYCVSIVRNGESGSIYINGEAAAQEEGEFYHDSFGRICIGSLPDAKSYEQVRSFAGLVGSVDFYDRALSEIQLKQITNLAFSDKLATFETINRIPESAVFLNEHHYLLMNASLNTEDAKRCANALGGHLATIESAEENTAVSQYVKDSGFTKAHVDLALEGEVLSTETFDEKEIGEETVFVCEWEY